MERSSSLGNDQMELRESLQNVSATPNSTATIQIEKRLKGFEVSIAQLQSRVNSLDRIAKNGFKNDQFIRKMDIIWDHLKL